MSAKNMVAMFGAMAMMRRIDQEEPVVLRYARLGFVLYILVTAGIYMLLHLRITSRKDTTQVRVPKKAKTPSISETFKNAAEQAERMSRERQGIQDTSPPQEGETNNNDNNDQSNEDDEDEIETITAMEYDLRQLANARRSWITNACLLSAIHYKMESVSPLIITPLMGTLRLLTDDPLFQIYVLGTPAVGKLQRPFKADVSPLQSMLKEFAPKDPSETEQSSAQNSQATSTQPNGTVSRATGNTPTEELHDDGDSEEDEDEPPRGIADLTDDHIKSDFDDEKADDDKKDEEEKKNQ